MVFLFPLACGSAKGDRPLCRKTQMCKRDMFSGMLSSFVPSLLPSRNCTEVHQAQGQEVESKVVVKSKKKTHKTQGTNQPGWLDTGTANFIAVVSIPGVSKHNDGRVTKQASLSEQQNRCSTKALPEGYEYIYIHIL